MNDYNNIYWREISMAPAHLTLKEDINLTKYMSGWLLNTGKQKGLFGKVFSNKVPTHIVIENVHTP